MGESRHSIESKVEGQHQHCRTGSIGQAKGRVGDCPGELRGSITVSSIDAVVSTSLYESQRDCWRGCVYKRLKVT